VVSNFTNVSRDFLFDPDDLVYDMLVIHS